LERVFGSLVEAKEETVICVAQSWTKASENTTQDNTTTQP